MEAEEVAKFLDEESFAILKELEEVLEAVEIDSEKAKEKGNNHEEEEEEEDPDSQEHELALLMDSLVAELRADLQTQMVEDLSRSSKKKDPPAEEEEVPTTKQFEVPVLDFTGSKATRRLSDAQKELLQRLRSHLQCQKHPTSRKEDRVYQEIPDLESSQNEVCFETIATALPGDADFVPLDDFTPTKKKKQHQSDKDTPETNKELLSRARSHTGQQPSLADPKRQHQSRDKQLEAIIERMAQGRVWRRICQIVFHEEPPACSPQKTK